MVPKVVSAPVAHRSEAGLAILNLPNVAALRDAFGASSTRCSALGIEPEGFLVAEQLPGAVEVVIGLHHDLEIGPVVMFGAGGVFLELTRDIACGPPGLDAERARDMIASTRVATLLGGYRGSPPCDLQGPIGVLTAIGALAQEIGDLVESLEINPLLVRPDGVFALDALIIARGRALQPMNGGYL